MAYIDSVDTNRPLIEQLEDIYWLPFNTAPVHHYDLGPWHLSMTGELATLMLWEDSGDYVSHVMHRYHGGPLWDIDNYQQLYGEEPLGDSESPCIWLEFHPIVADCRVEMGPDEVWGVGAAFFKIRVIQVREPGKSEVFDLSDGNQLKQFIFRKHKDSLDRFLELGHEDRFSAWNPDEIQEYEIKGRRWYELIDGNRALNWCFNLYTHLSDKHLLHIAYEPRQFWPPYHTPSEKALQVSKSPLWDFLDNLEPSKVEKENRREDKSEVPNGWGEAEGWGW
ncbi:hypothetical protein ACJJIK_03910 [Microbulbifer sp. ZKSA006]|uniref:hypothetical protein n=1 Tax=Microbulbifer sp. ZKSA006 TaxID=3243390 RepID=UPI004039433D